MKILLRSLTVASCLLSGYALKAQGYVTSQNGLVSSMVIDSFANPGGNEVLNYTGSFFNGVNWSLSIVDLDPYDGLESAGQNPYNTRFDIDGSRVNLVANNKGPWNYDNYPFQNQWNEDAEPVPNRSFYNAYGSYNLASGSPHLFGSGAQTYLSPTRYEFSFDTPLTEVYMYIQDLDDAMLSNFNITPTIVQTSQYRWSGQYGGDGHQKGMLVWDATYGAIKDFDGKGEGLAIGTEGLPWQLFGGNHQNEWYWNPASAGVIRFYDPAGITSLSFDVSLLPSAIDGNSANNSDGFFFTLAVPVPEPNSAIMVGVAGLSLIFRRRKLA